MAVKEEVEDIAFSIFEVIFGLSVIPFAFLILGIRERKVHLLEKWVKTNNDILYFIEPNLPVHIKLKDSFNDTNYLEKLISTSENEEYINYYQI